MTPASRNALAVIVLLLSGPFGSRWLLARQRDSLVRPSDGSGLLAGTSARLLGRPERVEPRRLDDARSHLSQWIPVETPEEADQLARTIVEGHQAARVLRCTVESPRTCLQDQSVRVCQLYGDGAGSPYPRCESLGGGRRSLLRFVGSQNQDHPGDDRLACCNEARRWWLEPSLGGDDASAR